MTDKYEITILNWDKYQREMKGGEKRRRRRDWVAISTGLLHDPDFFRLTIEQRYLWVMLLCYAGAVGPVFELCASDARVLFKLRRNADFQPFADQGLIDLHTATRQDITRHNRTVKRGAKRAPQNYEPSSELLEQLCAETGTAKPMLWKMLAEMKDHEFRNPKKDWNAVYRNWVRRAAEWRKDETHNEFDGKLAQLRTKAGLD